MGGGLTKRDEECGAEEHDRSTGVCCPFEVACVADHSTISCQRRLDVGVLILCLPSDDGVHHCRTKTVGSQNIASRCDTQAMDNLQVVAEVAVPAARNG